MHPSSATSTPFSVKDILRLEQHHEYENDFLMTDQVVPMHHQHMHAASRNSHFYDCQPEPCVSEVQEKFKIHNSSAEEEINEHGEMMHNAHYGEMSCFICTDACRIGFRPLQRVKSGARPSTCHRFFFYCSTLKKQIPSTRLRLKSCKWKSMHLLCRYSATKITESNQQY